MGLKMPWAWRCGPSYASERHHLKELLESQRFPEKTLLCGDAGFVGYELWQAIAGHGCHFLMRVGSNIRLLRRLGEVRRRDDLVFFWPNTAARAKQPPMLLRLLAFQTGRCRVYAVTNVLADRDLTVRQAKLLYENRWGVELQFRSLKQTFGRSKLQSRTPERAYVELAWSLVGLWLIQLLAVSEQIPSGIGPEQSSVSVAVQIFRDVMRAGPRICLRDELRGAVKDSYTRRSTKAGRYRPQKKDKPSAGKPNVINASAKQRRTYRTIVAVK
jgi:Transposase DDE domain